MLTKKPFFGIPFQHKMLFHAAAAVAVTVAVIVVVAAVVFFVLVAHITSVL